MEFFAERSVVVFTRTAGEESGSAGLAVVSGGDGSVKLFDARARGGVACQEMKDGKDAVTKVACTKAWGGARQEAAYCVLATSLDGSLRQYDFRKGCVQARLLAPECDLSTRLYPDKHVMCYVVWERKFSFYDIGMSGEGGWRGGGGAAPKWRLLNGD